MKQSRPLLSATLSLPDSWDLQIGHNTGAYFVKPAKSPKQGLSKFLPPSPHIQLSEGIQVIHRDITLPYGVDISSEDVLQSLSELESLGTAEQADFKFHTLFQEDTQQGTTHRVLVSLQRESSESGKNAPFTFPLTLVSMSLAESVFRETKVPSFQLVVSYPHSIHSINYKEGLVNHILSIKLTDHLDLSTRLQKHYEFTFGKTTEIPVGKISISGNTNTNEPVDRNQNFAYIESKDQSWLVNVNSNYLKSILQEPLAAAVLGLFQSPELLQHNHANPNTTEKFKSQQYFYQFSVSAVVSLCIALFFIVGTQIHQNNLKNKVASLETKMGSYTKVVEQMEAYKQKNLQWENHFSNLSGLWENQVPWAKVLMLIQDALPEGASINGVLSNHTSGLQYEINYKTFFKNWDQVNVFEQNLLKNKLIKEVKVQDLSLNPETRQISASVLCRIEI